MYAKHGNFVDADASGAKAGTKHLESRLEIIHCHAFWHHWKADEGLRITMWALEMSEERSEHPRFRQPHCRHPLYREPREYPHKPCVATCWLLELGYPCADRRTDRL